MGSIEQIVEALLKYAPPKYNGYKQRFAKNQLGIKSMLKILADFGYTIEITVKPPQ